MNHTKLLQSALESIRGYRQEHSDAQPCDTERAIEAALAEQAAEPATEADMAVYKAIADNYRASLPQAAEPVDADRARFIIAHLCNTFPELAHCHPARQQQAAEPVGTLSIKSKGHWTTWDTEWHATLPPGEYPLYLHP